MPTSQFTLYSSADYGAPIISGSGTGSLLNVLNACLVTGYGTMPGAGWTKPVADSNNVGCFRQGTGSMMTLAVIDNSEFAASSKEARIQGWETITNITAGVPSGSGTAPYGVGSFPSGSQSGLRYIDGGGYLIVRKTNAVDSTERPWLVFADSSSVYFFVLSGDAANFYNGFFFGDVYSFQGASDAYRCLIVGKTNENDATITNERIDAWVANPSTATAGHFLARSYTGAGVSITANKHGDYTKGNGSNSGFFGNAQIPNGADLGLWLSPIWVGESATSTMRGMLRGVYHWLHAVASSADGQMFSSADGRQFVAIKTVGNSGTCVIEVSNTVPTN